jgi:dTDP-4-dehydrorhamnose reductase
MFRAKEEYMKVLITGVRGQLGFDVEEECKSRGIIPVGVDIEDMDITDAVSTGQVIKAAAPDAVIHCAAYTAVDAAEDHEELCRKVNRDGTQNIADVCKELDIPMMYISTDYVFDGEGDKPWEPEDERHPLNVYGQTKYEGELAVQNTLEKYFILRITWVFGINGKNFVRAILQKAKELGELKVVDDQIGSPTYTDDLARLMVDMIETDRYGIYHASNEGICSWYEFACEIVKTGNVDARVIPVDSSVYPAKAKRPKNSRMSKKKLVENGFTLLPSWQDALSRYIPVLEAQTAQR